MHKAGARYVVRIVKISDHGEFMLRFVVYKLPSSRDNRLKLRGGNVEPPFASGQVLRTLFRSPGVTKRRNAYVLSHV